MGRLLETTPGNKFYHWEMKGVPLRIEIGPRDAEAKTAVLVRRDTGEKKTISLNELNKEVKQTLDDITENMKKESLKEMISQITDSPSIEDAQEKLREKGGIIRTVWCGEKECGLEIEEVLNATLLGTSEEKPKGECVHCQGDGRQMLLISRSY
jgi:prolyl-tRNA synthetase